MKKAKQSQESIHHDFNLINHEDAVSLRLNKYISDSGYCSRREADRQIQAGNVFVDGVMAEVGMQIYDYQEVRVGDTRINANQDRVYIMLHKPRGITCTTDLNQRDNIVTYMNYDQAIFPIGRLDKDTSGLILLTNDGDIVNKILREENGHDKEYIVKVDKHIKKDFIKNMETGVDIYNPRTHEMQRTNPCTVKRLNSHEFKIILNQGLNLQIRRMCKALDYRVVDLKRIRVMNVHLQDLAYGEWRYLTNDELKVMNGMLVDSKK